MSMSSLEAEVKVKPQGKRKIPIEKIEDKAKKQVTFSKRRMGLFKKAGELCALCDAETAVFTFSGAGKVFSFGHPSADEVVNRYLYGSTSSLDLKDHRRIVQEYNRRYNQSLEHIRDEKARGTMIQKLNAKYAKGRFWWEEPVEDLGLEELEQYMTSLKELRDNVASKVGQIMNNNGTQAPPHQLAIDLNKGSNQVNRFVNNNVSPFMGDDIDKDVKNAIVPSYFLPQ